MLYQLPSGKVIYLSVEEYLSLSDKELHELTHSGYGDDPSYNFSFNKGAKIEKDKPAHKESELDYTPERDDDQDTIGPLNLNNLPED